MPRTKGGVVARRRRNRVLKAAKGFWGSKHCLFKVANQQVMKGRQYAFRDRKNNKRNFRKLWIVRINAASRALGLSYNQLMHGLKLANIEINRKMLADLAVNDAAMFASLCETAKAKLNK
jgi:large subunit ribosomal protein L20